MQLAGEVFPLGYARKSSDANVGLEDRTLTVGEVPNLYDRTRQLDSDFIFAGCYTVTNQVAIRHRCRIDRTNRVVEW